MNTKGNCYPKAIIVQALYFKLRSTLSYREADEIMKAQGASVDQIINQR